MISFIKKAFSLTELLIVLVIVAVLFAALAPIMTKRRDGSSSANEAVWMFVKQDDQGDAFYDSGVPALTSAALVGLEARDISINMAPYSKMYVKAKPLQNQIQFRYGTDAGIGALAGVFTLDNRGNLMTTGRLQGNKDNNYNLILQEGGIDNTIAGMGALSQVKSQVSWVTAIGANSVMKGSSVIVVAVGRNSNMYGKALGSVLLGANTGKFENSEIDNTVAVGANSLSTEMYSGSKSFNNVFLGSGTANVGFSASSNNVIAGSSYYGISARNNTMLGYGTYTTGGNTGAQNFTIAGYGACDSFQNTGNGNVTCLGYRSAVNYGTNAGTSGLGWENDIYEHIFIGGKPYGGMGGRAALEVHNMTNPTVVLNSNLVVRGNYYFNDVSTDKLITHDQTYTQGKYSGTEAGKDRCGRRCIFGRKKWRNSKACSWFLNIISLIALGATVVSIVATGGASLGVIISTGGLGSGLGLVGAAALFRGSGYHREKDGPSASIMVVSSSSRTPYCNSESSENYPTSAYCPQLQLSDRRTKDNIIENKDALDKIMYVMPYNYTYKADKDNTPQVGVIAQDLEKYSPNSVSKDDKGYLSIRWDELFYITINSVKALDEKLTNLDSTVQSVEKDTASLKCEQKATKNRIKEISKRIDKLEK